MNDNKWEEKEKDKIVQVLYDLLEKYDWGGDYHKIVLEIPFKGKFNMLDADVRVKEKLHLT